MASRRVHTDTARGVRLKLRCVGDCGELASGDGIANLDASHFC